MTLHLQFSIENHDNVYKFALPLQYWMVLNLLEPCLNVIYRFHIVIIVSDCKLHYKKDYVYVYTYVQFQIFKMFAMFLLLLKCSRFIHSNKRIN